MTTRQEIYDEGYDRGRNIASWQDLPEIGTEIQAFELPNFYGVIEGVQDAEDVFMEICSEAESTNREFTPFEFTCQHLNQLEEKKPYDVWAVFDKGIYAGFVADWNSRKDYYEETNDEVKN